MLKLCNDLAFSRADAQLLLEVLIYNLFISIHYVTALAWKARQGKALANLVPFSSLMVSVSNGLRNGHLYFNF